MVEKSPEKARQYLLSFGAEQTTPWVRHSLLVAQVARRIAEALQQRGIKVDVSVAEIGGLLHDIGRSRSHHRHPLEGYYLLRESEWAEFAPFCLSHYLKGRQWEDLQESHFWSPEELEEWRQLLATLGEPSWEEKVVMYADSLCAEGHILSLEERWAIWQERYGDSRWLQKGLTAMQQLEKQWEHLLGCSPLSLVRPLTHLNEHGEARMVNIGYKAPTYRRARAVGKVCMGEATKQIALSGRAKKGEVFQVARLAGILAAKRTAELIPLCHTLPLTSVAVHFWEEEDGIAIEAIVETVYATGVEMEALTAASVAALTLYDMLKSVDKEMVLGPIYLAEKQGGKSGDFVHPRERKRKGRGGASLSEKRGRQDG